LTCVLGVAGITKERRTAAKIRRANSREKKK
jgi:hypothetical protein